MVVVSESFSHAQSLHNLLTSYYILIFLPGANFRFSHLNTDMGTNFSKLAFENYGDYARFELGEILNSGTWINFTRSFVCSPRETFHS